MKVRAVGVLTAVLVLVIAALPLGARPAGAQQGAVRGRVEASGSGLAGADVALLVAAVGEPLVLGTGRTESDGTFVVELGGAIPPSGVVYAVASSPPDGHALGVTLVSVLGVGGTPDRVVVNELTTVAASFALAQFTRPGSNVVSGPTPGLPNAVGMAHNLVDPTTGERGAVLRSHPNGDQTSTEATVGSLANVVAACIDGPAACEALQGAATSPEGVVPLDTHQALVNVALDPWHQVDALYEVSTLGPVPYQPARTASPEAWTIALRFDGDGQSINGPGNFAIDHEGNLYVTNNYDYSPDPNQAVCGSDLLLKFGPDGSFVPGSPYRGGGLSGAGYGVTIDPYGDIWVGNYGFAAPPPGCPDADQPRHDSVSRFRPDGTPASPATGYTQGDIDWPQGTVADRRGTIWIANCAGASVTIVPQGDPDRARALTDLGLEQPFDVAFNNDGTAFVTGIGSSTVAMLDPDGHPRPGSPITGDVLNRPMGIAADSAGNQWVANSGFIDLPCPDVARAEGSKGSVGLIAADGTPRAAFDGGGLTIPWGIAVDGDDNVWVSNFAGKRISQFCGVKAFDCRPGTTTGSPISPANGYVFDGLTRSTAVAIDPSGNVWATNNWKEIPVQTNPGGYQIVAYVGLAAPVQPPTPTVRPAAPPAVPVVSNPIFTG